MGSMNDYLNLELDIQTLLLKLYAYPVNILNVDILCIKNNYQCPHGNNNKNFLIIYNDYTV